jgi:hypothetical protein
VWTLREEEGLTKLIPAIELSFEGEKFPVYLGSDRRLYARFLDLCHVAGLPWKKYLERLEQDTYLVSQLVMLAPEGQQDEHFMNLGAMSYWLGTLQPRRMRKGKARERVQRFQRQFRDTTWLLRREGFEISTPEETWVGEDGRRERSLKWPIPT